MPEQPEHMKDMLISLSADMALESEKAALTLEQIVSKMQRSGMGLNEIESLLLRDLREGGQIFGDFRKNFKSQMRYGIEESGRGSVIDMFKDVELWDWVGISDKKICPDCLKRHNMEPQPYPTWQRIGLPGNGGTICGRGCRCTLVPDDSVKKPDGGIVRNLPPKIPSFAPAKTVQDAENFAKKSGMVKNVNYTNVTNLNYVNRINSEVIDTIKSSKLKPIDISVTKLKTQTFAESNFKEIRYNATSFNEKRIAKEMDKTVTSFKQNIQKQIDVEIDKYKNIPGIVNPVVESLNESIKFNRQYVLIKGKEIECITRHELGHVLTDQKLGFTNPGARSANVSHKIKQELTQEWVNTYNKMISNGDVLKISEYGAQSMEECFSECYTMFKYERANLPNYVIDIIQRIEKL